MNGPLFQDSKYVFKFSGEGDTKINKVLVKNYNVQKTDLFEYFYNTSNKNAVYISNSSFCTLRNWSEKLIYPI